MFKLRLFALLTAIAMLTGAAGAHAVEAAILGGAAIPGEAASEAEEPENLKTSDTGMRPVQVFDVVQGKVVKSVPNDAKFQKMASSWIQSISGLAPQVSAGENCSYVYRVPLARQTAISSGTIKIASGDLFLFYCKDKPPLLLAFDDQRKPYMFQFNADIRPFIKKVGLPANNG